MKKIERTIGFGTGFFKERGLTHPQMIQEYIKIGCKAVEIGIMRSHQLDQNFDNNFFNSVQSFSYKSLHLPSKIFYPSPELDKILPEIFDLADNIKVNTLVLHSDYIKDFGWVKDAFNRKPLAVENLDWRVDFGSSVSDMERVFTKLPDAKWVFDLNHIYTIDKSMKLAKEFYQNFHDRLVHYHLSGFNNPEKLHDCLCETHEDIIFQGIMDHTTPIIIESVAHNDSLSPQDELNYVIDHLALKI